MKKNVNLNTIITTVCALLIMWMIQKVDENYNVLIVVKANQLNVISRLDKFETRMADMQTEIARIAAEVEILKKKNGI